MYPRTFQYSEVVTGKAPWAASRAPDGSQERLSWRWGSRRRVCCVLAAGVGGGEARAAAPGERLQEGVFTPGIQETFVPQNQGGARQQQLLAGYVAMGTVGGGEHGLHNAPPPPPPTWSRGGHSWVYDGP
jgi:hypothetical protein